MRDSRTNSCQSFIWSIGGGIGYKVFVVEADDVDEEDKYKEQDEEK